MVTVEEIFTVLKNQNLIDTLAEFSRWCGRKRSWASVSMSRGMSMPLDAMVSVYCHLLAMRDASHDDRLQVLLADTWGHICSAVNQRDYYLLYDS
ncbi:hypothetical protein GCM10011332_30680 [Terasakiella brassicae]|uniref:Uncharacterized protein n=1 Tax=Terasakiella brassicae TaxID=1634917 RepID=A0A917C7M9_9PROT|nr:hypothetical protein [Terasakiella brassicae]GGF74414.1 hypothetical protein GCM10011332_30680 [Terasakiella brassicae]